MPKKKKNLIGSNRLRWWQKTLMQKRGVINEDTHPKTDRQRMIDSLREFWVKYEEKKYTKVQIEFSSSKSIVDTVMKRSSQPAPKRKISFLSVALPDNPFDSVVQSLYIRPSYVQIKALLAETDSRRALITGPPGAGVSKFFFFYLKDCMIREKTNLVILTRGFIKGYEYVLFASSMVFILDTETEALPYLNSPDAHYLVKPAIGETIPVYPAKTYVIASLTQLSECNFDMDGWATHYIPSWSTIEMQQWLKITLPRTVTSTAIYRERAEWFGPNPKNIYDPNREEEIEKNKERIDVLTKRSFTELKEIDSRLTMKDKDFHLMIGLEVADPNFTTYKLQVCSQEVARELCTTFNSFSSQEMIELAKIAEESKDSYIGVLLKGFKDYQNFLMREFQRLTNRYSQKKKPVFAELPSK